MAPSYELQLKGPGEKWRSRWQAYVDLQNQNTQTQRHHPEILIHTHLTTQTRHPYPNQKPHTHPHQSKIQNPTKHHPQSIQQPHRNHKPPPSRDPIILLQLTLPFTWKLRKIRDLIIFSRKFQKERRISLKVN